MKIVLSALMLLLTASASYAAVKSGFGHYLLIEPSSTVETDLSGRCVRVANVGDASVYLPLTPLSDFDDALDVAVKAKQLKVIGCGGR